MKQTTQNNDTVEIFAARYNLTSEQLIRLNSPALDTAAADSALTQGTDYEVGGYFPGDPLPPITPANTGFHWLTYETRFNAADYRKEPDPVAYGLYAVPLDHRVEVVASETLPDALAKAFFPGMSVDEVKAVSNQTCRWRGAEGAATGHGPNSPAGQTAARGQAVLHIPRMIVMPYNYFANDAQSHSIGGDVEKEVVPGPAFRLKKWWPLWETASRSSISRLEETTEDDLDAPARLEEGWKFRTKGAPDATPLPPTVLGKPFDLSTADLKKCFSVKTGVRWIGKKAQGSDDPGGGKDVLESNALLASMRSDWVEHVEATVGKDANLIVLRELLTVTFPNAVRNTRDGYQIRDLSGLTNTRIYFPPLSIPFDGQAFVDAYNQRNPTEQKTFTVYWREAYAAAVGRAKAELLLRYGLQLTTPNPQNFLLEFDKDTLKPTGAVVVRDIGDAKIHSEVIAQIGLDHPVIKYELEDPNRPGYLPAQTNNEGRADDHYAAEHGRLGQYPLDTRMHWHQYSSFKLQYGGKYLPERELTIIDWGRAHYDAYVGHLSAKLGVQFPALGQDVLDAARATRDPALKAFKEYSDAMKALNAAKENLANAVAEAEAARERAAAARTRADRTPTELADLARTARGQAVQKKLAWDSAELIVSQGGPKWKAAQPKKDYEAADRAAREAELDQGQDRIDASHETARLAEQEVVTAEDEVVRQESAVVPHQEKFDQAAANPLWKNANKYNNQFMEPAGGDMNAAPRQFYRERVETEKDLEKAMDTEWILEVHADDKIHEMLVKSENLARIKAKWSTEWNTKKTD